MRKLKLFFACLLMAVLSIGQMWAGEVAISPSQALNDGGVSPITIACAKGDGTANPTISSGQLRLYQAAKNKTTGNTISFSSEKTITSIVFTFANNMTASNGSFSEGTYDAGTSTWTGSSTSLTLTVTGTTSGTRIYITNMVVTYDDGGSSDACATPTFNPAAGAVASGTQVAISCATEGATIHYTTDGTDPIATSATYSSAITIDEDKTIKAIAIKEGLNNSAIATAAYTVLTPLTTMQAIFDRATEIGDNAADVVITFNNWVVSGKTNNNAYITDGTKGFVIFGSGHGFAVNNKINGTVLCKLQLYKGAPQVTNLNANNSNLTITNDGVVTPVVVNIADMNGAYTGAPIIVNDVTFNGTALVDASSNAITPYTTFYNGAVSDLELNHKYNVTGIFIQYNTTKELSPRSAADIEEVFEKHTVIYNAAPDHGTLTIKNGDDVVASGSQVNENTVLTIIAAPAEGYKVAEITVNGIAYTESTLTLTEDVTIAASFEQNLAPLVTSYDLSERGVVTSHLNGERVGDKVNLPLTAATCSKVFVGWDEDENCSTQPAYAPGAEYTLTADNKLYAVYAVATPGSDVDYPIDFENNVDTYADWTFVNMTCKETDSNVPAHGDSYFGTTGGKATATITTKDKIANPSSITFYYSKKSTNTSESYWKVEVSSNGSAWIELSSRNAGNGVNRGTWYEYTEDLSDYSDVYVRVAYSLSTAVRCIDDLVLTAAGEPIYSDFSTDCPAIVHTVRFWNSLGWGTVKAHVWNDNGDVTNWPGEDTQFADGWNEFVVEEGNSLLFHNNDGTQTVDINNVQADVCYVLTGEADNLGHKYVVADNECKDRFYIAGSKALTGVDGWAPIRLENGSITFKNVAASNDLQFKINNGAWAWNRGKDYFDGDCSNISIWAEQQDGNVGFETDKAKDITISYDKENDKICVTADDYVAPDYVAFVVAFGDKHYAMTTSNGNNGFAPLEVTIDADGNVIVQSEAEKNSILWLRTVDGATATFRAGENMYLAQTGTGTDLMLSENPSSWIWDGENGYYYITVGEDNRTFYYRGSTYNIFKNYKVSGLGGNGYSAAPTIYAAAKVVVSTTAKLKFYAPVAWGDNVKAFTWKDEILVNYPMTAVEEGSRWFECDLPKGLEFLIYNGEWGGLNQTANIGAIDADKCFAWTAATNDDGKIVATEITSCEMNYYIAGDMDLTGVAEWGHKALVNNALTFNEVEANTYKFKITNGSWAWNLGAAYVDADACVGVTIEDTDDNGNVVFTINDESNITIAYNPATEKISIVADVPTPKEYYTKVTSTEDITAGTYLIVNEDEFGSVAFNGALTSLDAKNNVIDVEIVGGNKIEVSEAVNAASFVIDPELGSIKSASGKYIGISSYGNGLNDNGKIYTYANEFNIDGDGNAVITIETSGGTMTMRYNAASDQNRFRYFKSGQQPIQLYKKAGVAKPLPELAFNPNAVEAIKGDAFVAPALTNTNNVSVAYESSATGKASVVAETGEVTIKNAGDAIIYAVSAANDDYRESYAKYSIHISEYTTVRTELELDRYYTVCLEKNITKAKGASFWNLTYKNAEAATLVFLVEADELEAGKPYIFQAEADKLEVVYGAETANAPVENGALRGTFEDIDAAAFAGLSGNPYLLINNALCPRATNNYLSAHRAYIEFDALTVAPAQGFAPGKRVRSIPMQPNTATGIDALNATDKPVKVVIDGKMLILRGEKMYDATGRLVK